MHTGKLSRNAEHAFDASGSEGKWTFTAATERKLSFVRRAYSKFRKARFLGTGGLEPLSRDFGFDQGKPVDRHYIETFLALHADDVRGRVLEVGDNAYTMEFGGNRVLQSDVLHVLPGIPGTTIVGDLSQGNSIPSNAFDCIVLTQTLHLIFEMSKAVATLHRSLRPGGVLLITVPGVSSVARGEWGDTWYWSLTPAALRRLLAQEFKGDLSVHSFGNVLAASAFLYGVAAEEMSEGELAAVDSQYPVTVAARAVKAG